MNSSASPAGSGALRPARSAAFKRESRRDRKDRKQREKLAESLALWAPLGSSSIHLRPDPPLIDVPWPCEEEPVANPNPNGDGWAPFGEGWAMKATRKVAEFVVRQDEEGNAVRKCKEFFEKGEEGESDGEGEDESGGVIFEFFEGLFANNVGLKRHYEERKEKGELVCLVCEKRFVGCVGLVQHARTVSKTKRAAHRVYGSAVSRALGLETDRAQTQLEDSEEGNAADSKGDLVDMDT